MNNRAGPILLVVDCFGDLSLVAVEGPLFLDTISKVIILLSFLFRPKDLESC